MINRTKDRVYIVEMTRRNPALEGSNTWTSMKVNDEFLMDLGGFELLIRVCFRKLGTKLKIEYSDKVYVNDDVTKERMKISNGKVLIANLVLLHIPIGVDYKK